MGSWTRQTTNAKPSKMHAAHQSTKAPQGTLSGFEVTMDILACPRLASAHLSSINSFQNRLQQHIIIVSLFFLSWDNWINGTAPFPMSGLPQTICLRLYKTEWLIHKSWDWCNFYHVLLNWYCTALDNLYRNIQFSRGGYSKLHCGISQNFGIIEKHWFSKTRHFSMGSWMLK